MLFTYLTLVNVFIQLVATGVTMKGGHLDVLRYFVEERDLDVNECVIFARDSPEKMLRYLIENGADLSLSKKNVSHYDSCVGSLSNFILRIVQQQRHD